jgi:hypothetical protein
MKRGRVGRSRRQAECGHVWRGQADRAYAYKRELREASIGEKKNGIA